MVSSTGTWAFNVGLYAFVFDRTHSFGWVGAAGAVRFVSALVFSPLGGVVAERIERIRLMVGSDLACLIWQAAAAATAAAGGPVVLVVLMAVLTTATNCVYPPAVAATIPSVVDEDDLVAANALNGTIDNLVMIVGPAIGAALLLVGTPTLVFAINAASFALSAIAVSRIRARTQRVEFGAGVAGVLRQMGVGARTIVSLPAARTLVGFAVLVSFVYGTTTVLFVAVSADRLGTGPRGYGYLLAGLGVGGIIMAAAIDRLARSSRLSLIILAGTVGYCSPIALLAIIHDPGLAFAVQVIRGAATLVVDVLAITALQRAVPSEQVARVFGIYFAFMLGAIALGAAVTPAVISAAGLNSALYAIAFGTTALGLLGFPALLAIDRGASARAIALAPDVAILEQLEVFATASRPLLERLAGSAVEVQSAAGNAIVREGEPADAMYVLIEGEVEVTARGELESERTIRTMSAPSYFGEIGVLEHIPRTATVTALRDCRCERIDGEALLEALTTAPASSSLMENVRSRLALTHPSQPVGDMRAGASRP
jgi:MFS family permease